MEVVMLLDLPAQISRSSSQNMVIPYVQSSIGSGVTDCTDWTPTRIRRCSSEDRSSALFGNSSLNMDGPITFHVPELAEETLMDVSVFVDAESLHLQSYRILLTHAYVISYGILYGFFKLTSILHNQVFCHGQICCLGIEPCRTPLN